MARVYITLFAGVTVLVAFGAILSPVEGSVKKALQACMQQTGATEADFQTFVKTGEATQQVKCMLSCALQSLKFMTSDGTLDTTYMKSTLPSALGSVVDTCTGKASSESNICQRATTYLHCFLSAEPKFFVTFITAD